MSDPADNPLLYHDQLPPFSRITPDAIEPAVDTVLADARATVEAVAAAPDGSTWNTVVVPLEAALDRVARVWNPVRHLHGVASTEDLRAAYNRCLPKITAFHTELAQHRGLHAAYRAIADGPEYASLDATRRKAIDDALRDFRLGGVDLPEEPRARCARIEAELAELQTRFEENVLDATQAWSRQVTSEDDLSGLSPEVKAMARAAAERAGLDGWLLTLEFPVYYGVMTSAGDRTLRRELYEAWTTRASDRGPHAGEWDNSGVMERIVALRQEKARLLGFGHYAELALATRMVRSPEEVLRFLNDLAGRALPAGRHEVEELRAFAIEQLGLPGLEPWDVPYVAEKLRQARFEVSDEQLKPYFPAPRVIDGLFRVVGALYGVDIEAVPGVDAWHPDVAYYRVRDADGTERGGFYLDLYARPDKRGGAWMDACVTRMPLEDGLQRPVAFLTCNLSPPVEDRPALFTHDEVLTLFHEFGHGLHHLLTLVDVPSLAGINGVEWDAVELPSQLMENWCWERESLDLVAGHVDTGEPLPAELLERLQASRHFQGALGLLRQVEFSLFDFRLHMELDAPAAADIRALLGDVRGLVSLVPPPEYNRFAHAFSHIFAGGYAAGYYSYKWAEVLAADAFGAFQEAGVLDRDTGEAFLHAVLERGGSRPAIESYREFRGRDPDPSALLRQAGLAA
ncbi:MAG: M3 family metallopeptidase [Halofilum sp. (in: g-proteobacteria)]|nr:M3 family metallopeptidase [Halofilum sp. (in: g-proteobacteria)]